MSEEVKEVKTEGAFVQSLKRNNKEIREDRADMIAKNAKTMYSRTIQDIEMKIDQLKIDQTNMLDMSPENALNLRVASDFNADEYVRKDIDLGKKIKNSEEVLEIAKARFNHLFGGE